MRSVSSGRSPLVFLFPRDAAPPPLFLPRDYPSGGLATIPVNPEIQNKLDEARRRQEGASPRWNDEVLLAHQLKIYIRNLRQLPHDGPEIKQDT
jgi:hypothetical protein